MNSDAPLDSKADFHNYEVESHEADPLKEKEKEDTKPKDGRSIKETIKYAFSNITVEPTLFLFVCSTLFTILTSQNLNLEKACRVNLNFTKEICDSLRMQDVETENEFERETQKLITSAMAWKTYLTATIPCFFALFVGSWSDRTGYRKVFILIPIIGQMLVCVNGFINVYFFYELRLEYFVISEGILEGLGGSWCICFLVAFAYISAITTTETRTFRLGLVNFCVTVGFPVGMSLSGVILKNYGYYGCYGLSCGLNVINFCYNLFFLKDTSKTKEQEKECGHGLGHFFRTFFDLTNLKATVKTVFKQGPNNRRARIIILLMVVAILFGPMHGELSIFYISTRYRFNWDEVKFSIFQTYNFIVHTIGTLFSLTVFSKYLGWHDSLLGMISTVSKITASFLYCFAPNDRIFLLGPMIEILNGTSFLALRSIISKIVASDELGKVNSLFALTENLMPLIYIPLYTKMYSATMEILPGAVFLMGAAMTVPAVAVFSWLFYEHRINLKKSKKQSLE